jgi:hypothetical protein
MHEVECKVGNQGLQSEISYVVKLPVGLEMTVAVLLELLELAALH